MKIISYIFSLFGTKKCLGCQKSGHFFCLQCQNSMHIYSPQCYFCKKISHDFSVHNICKKQFPLDMVIVLTRYRNKGIKKLLRHAKYYGKYIFYKDIIFSNKDFFSKNIKIKKSLLVPVPMHVLRKWKRGYNQSEKISKYLSNMLDIPVNNTLIYKKKYTQNQSHLSRGRRLNNLENSFGVRKNKVPKDMIIYLVDDIISTGSTLLEIKKELKAQGFKDVRAIALASD